MLFLVNLDNLALIMLLICIVPMAALIIFSVVKGIIKQKKYKNIKASADQEPVDAEQKNLFLSALGGQDNIIHIEQKLSRISVTVKDLNAINSDNLKSLGASGILMSEDTVTVTFGDRASYIYKMLTTENPAQESDQQ